MIGIKGDKGSSGLDGPPGVVGAPVRYDNSNTDTFKYFNRVTLVTLVPRATRESLVIRETLEIKDILD